MLCRDSTLEHCPASKAAGPGVSLGGAALMLGVRALRISFPPESVPHTMQLIIKIVMGSVHRYR
jgi:hypothetical protein